MSTLTWTGNAHSTRQVATITVANAWTAADTATLTINGKDLILTAGSTVTTAAIATAIKEMWMGAMRLDGSGSTDSTSNAGGQEFGEFGEVTATVSGSVVTLVANKAGKPFTLSVAEDTASTGTITLNTTQSATGPNHWDNGDNWDSGSAPSNDDTVIFRESDVSVLYGLPTNLEVTLHVYQSFTGRIGLPRINRDDPARPYTEYRQRYVRLNDAGGGSQILHRFGIGADGPGSPLINVKHSTLPCFVVVYNTGKPRPEWSDKALNLCCTANTSTLNIVNGSVDYSSQDGSTSAFVAVEQTGGDSTGIAGIHTTGATVLIAGGRAIIGGSGAIGTITVNGGALRLENQTGAITTLSINSGVVDYASTATITTLNLAEAGTFDARSGAGYFTITTANHRGGVFVDPYRRTSTGSTNIKLFIDFDRLQLGATPTASVSIDNS